MTSIFKHIHGKDDDPAPRNCVWASLIGLVLGIVLGALGARLLP